MKLIPFLIGALCCTMAGAQTFMQGFESNFLPANWDTLNLSGPAKGTVQAWFPSAQFSSPPAAAEGSKFFAANYKAEGNNGTISSWLFGPKVLLTDGDIISFYTRTLGAGTYPDRLELRISTNGTSINAGTSPTSVGDFSVVVATLNPSLTTTGYPLSWTKFKYTLSGLGTAGVFGRFAFRYFVTSAGPNGTNSDAIGLDSVYYRSNNTTGIIEATEKPFGVSPNPSTGLLQLNFNNESEKEITVLNILGETVETQVSSLQSSSLDLSAYPKGIYFIRIRQNEAYFIEKLILN